MSDAEKVLATINGILAECHLPALRNKKTRTHGGEWEGPCPHCLRLKGDGGTDRLVVWPQRPLLGGQYREEPVFMCRQCQREDRPTQPWSGDLVQFVMDTKQLTYPQALALLGLSDQELHGKGVLVPAHVVVPPPTERWQRRAEQWVEAAIARLWSAEGAPTLRYLTEQRGLSENVLKWARVGCAITYQYYEDGAAWDVANKVFLPRGVVFPEFHDDVLWSIAIRKPPMDVATEEAQTGRKATRYHTVAGGVKGLYLADTLTPGRPATLHEGQINALTAFQVCRGEVGAAATQGTTGARAPHWQRLLSYADPLILCFDPDEAGQGAMRYWQGVLENAGWSFPALDDDLNGLHVRGVDLASLFAAIYQHAMMSIGGQSESPDGRERQKSVNTLPENTGPFSAFSEPNSHTSQNEVDIDVLWARGCCVCGIEPEEIAEDGKSVWCAMHWKTHVLARRRATDARDKQQSLF